MSLGDKIADAINYLKITEYSTAMNQYTDALRRLEKLIGIGKRMKKIKEGRRDKALDTVTLAKSKLEIIRVHFPYEDVNLFGSPERYCRIDRESRQIMSWATDYEYKYRKVLGGLIEPAGERNLVVNDDGFRDRRT